MTSGLPGSFVSVGKLNQPKRSLMAMAWAAEAAPVPGSFTSIVTSKGWTASRRRVVSAVTTTVVWALAPWASRRTVYVPAALQPCDGDAVFAEVPSPKSQSHEVAGAGDVSRRWTAWPATGFGGSISKVTVGAAAARARKATVRAHRRMAAADPVCISSEVRHPEKIGGGPRPPPQAIRS